MTRGSFDDGVPHQGPVCRVQKRAECHCLTTETRRYRSFVFPDPVAIRAEVSDLCWAAVMADHC